MNRIAHPRRTQTMQHSAKLLLLACAIILWQSSHAVAQQWGTNGGNIYNTNSGNVGIGTIGPARRLEVQVPSGTDPIGRFSKVQTTNDSGGYIELFGGPTASTVRGFIGFTKTGTGAATIQANELADYLSIAAPVGKGIHLGTTGHYDPIMTLVDGGNAGIGTTAPNYKLDVQGGQVNASGGLCIAGDCKTSWSQVGGGASAQWAPSGNNIYYNSGSVGIGTTSPLPNARLDARSPYSYTDTAMRPAAFFGSSDANAPLGLAIQHSAYNGRYHIDLLGTRVGISGNDIDINVNNGSGGLTVQYQGNVGIGTTAPSHTLDVAGTINATGTITGGNIVAKYQDVAEWVEASHLMSAGTVVVLNPAKSNQVMASSQAYDTKVAGVVSAQPGIALGEAGEGKVLVATTGRVKVKVDATRSPVHIGDLLVTGDREGVAMRSEPLIINGRPFHAPGTLIGKALEPLESGVGEILVLLSLQ